MYMEESSSVYIYIYIYIVRKKKKGYEKLKKQYLKYISEANKQKIQK